MRLRLFISRVQKEFVPERKKHSTARQEMLRKCEDECLIDGWQGLIWDNR